MRGLTALTHNRIVRRVGVKTRSKHTYAIWTGQIFHGRKPNDSEIKNKYLKFISFFNFTHVKNKLINKTSLSDN